MNAELLKLAMNLLNYVEILHDARSLMTDSLSPYKQSATAAVHHSLEMLSGILCEGILREADIEDGKIEFDLGSEPESAEEAWNLLPSFVAVCRDLLRDSPRRPHPLPFADLYVRCTTFMCLIGELAAEESCDA